MPKTPSQRFGPYVILDRIGDGGMAEIFLAKLKGYSGFEKLVALKKIHPRYSQNDTFAQMLIHEAKLAATLNHFNVVQVHDLGEIDGQVYIAMEYVHGKDLAAVLSNTYRRKERLPINLALCVATEFMTGLDYAHRLRDDDGKLMGLIHRDISPQNVLISTEGEVKLTDFGIARVLSERHDGFQLPGNMHGKFGYMSPEQVRSQQIDQRSDIFSGGVVLWEMLTGRRLFRGKEHKETIKMIVSMPIPLPSSINPEVPAAVDQICLKALARDPNTRYQTTGALLGELSRVADDLPQRAATRDLAVYMRRQFGPSGSSFGRHRIGPSNSPKGDDRSLPMGTFSITADRVPIGQLMMEQGSLTAEELEIALAEQRARGGRIGELLVASGTVSEDDLLRSLSMQANVPLILDEDLRAIPPPGMLLQRFPREAAEATLILPISVNEEQRSVGLAVHDPYDERAILETKVVLGVNDVVCFVAKRTTLRAMIDAWYPDVAEEEAPFPETAMFEAPVEVVDGPPLVLIADADTEVAGALAERVREEDVVVIVATDGKQAREFCRDHRPTVAFLDASLPGIDGYNLLLELRSKSEDAAVFLTSSRGEEFRQAKALELGADDFVVKPYSLELMTSKIRREIRRRTEGGHMRAPTVQFEGVSGSLKDMTALDIVQSLEVGRKTAHVVLQYEDGRKGELRVDHGLVTGGGMGSVTGEAAFYGLTKIGDGLFRIEYRTSPVPRNIFKPNTYLMIEAMRRLDEQRGPTPAVDSVPPSPPTTALPSAPSVAPPSVLTAAPPSASTAAPPSASSAAPPSASTAAPPSASTAAPPSASTAAPPSAPSTGLATSAASFEADDDESPTDHGTAPAASASPRPAADERQVGRSTRDPEARTSPRLPSPRRPAPPQWGRGLPVPKPQAAAPPPDLLDELPMAPSSRPASRRPGEPTRVIPKVDRPATPLTTGGQPTRPDAHAPPSASSPPAERAATAVESAAKASTEPAGLEPTPDRASKAVASGDKTPTEPAGPQPTPDRAPTALASAAKAATDPASPQPTADKRVQAASQAPTNPMLGGPPMAPSHLADDLVLEPPDPPVPLMLEPTPPRPDYDAPPSASHRPARAQVGRVPLRRVPPDEGGLDDVAFQEHSPTPP